MQPPAPIEQRGRLRTRAVDGFPRHLLHCGSAVSGSQNSGPGPCVPDLPELRGGGVLQGMVRAPSLPWEVVQGPRRHLCHVAGIPQHCQPTPSPLLPQGRSLGWTILLKGVTERRAVAPGTGMKRAP